MRKFGHVQAIAHRRQPVRHADEWIFYFPRLSQTRLGELKARGIEAISAIPADFPLTAKQAVIRDATANGRPYIAPDLARLLRGYGPPTFFLDFEAMMPPIPLYTGTRPYQTLPFQWSMHAALDDGILPHRDSWRTVATTRGDGSRKR